MEIRNGKVILRDFVDTDIEDRIHWETVETEWQLWDAPWEYEQDEKPFDPEQYRSKMLERLSREKDECRLRSGFQICIDNPDRTHIGWCNAYRIDHQYNYTKDGVHCAIGIDIPPLNARRCGYATAAWKLFIEYLIESPRILVTSVVSKRRHMVLKNCQNSLQLLVPIQTCAILFWGWMNWHE